MPAMLGEEGTEQFEIITEVNGREVYRRKIHDPFISCTITIGWRDCLKALWRGAGKVCVQVRATHAAQRRIMTLDPVEMLKEENEWMHRPLVANLCDTGQAQCGASSFKARRI